MNKATLVGRLTRDPEVRYSQGENPMAIARYTIAVDRRFKRDGEPNADFIPCVCFGKAAEFVEKYFTKGLRVAVSGRIQTGSYTNKDGANVRTTEIVVEEQEFAESRSEHQTQAQQPQQPRQPQQQPAQSGAAQTPPWQQPGYSQQTMKTGSDGFMNIPDGIDEELPFN